MEFRYSKSSIGALAAAAAFTGACAGPCTSGHGPARAFGTVVLALTGSILLWLLALPFRRGVQVVIDERGIDDRQVGYGLIPWAAVRSVRLNETVRGNGRYLLVEVDDVEPYLRRVPAHRRPLARAQNRYPGGGALALNFGLLRPGAGEALAGAEEYLGRRTLRPPPRCEVCGYDLRATPDRCPECGTLADARRARR